MGLEPTTPGSTDRCSNQLSYGHHIFRKDRKRVSRVLFVTVIYLGISTGHIVAFVAALDFRPRRVTVFGGRFGDCSREDCPFHTLDPKARVSSLLLYLPLRPPLPEV